MRSHRLVLAVLIAIMPSSCSLAQAPLPAPAPQAIVRDERFSTALQRAQQLVAQALWKKSREVGRAAISRSYITQVQHDALVFMNIPGLAEILTQLPDPTAADGPGLRAYGELSEQIKQAEETKAPLLQRYEQEMQVEKKFRAQTDHLIQEMLKILKSAADWQAVIQPILDALPDMTPARRTRIENLVINNIVTCPDPFIRATLEKLLEDSILKDRLTAARNVIKTLIAHIKKPGEILTMAQDPALKGIPWWLTELIYQTIDTRNLLQQDISSPRIRQQFFDHTRALPRELTVELITLWVEKICRQPTLDQIEQDFLLELVRQDLIEQQSLQKILVYISNKIRTLTQNSPVQTIPYAEFRAQLKGETKIAAFLKRARDASEHPENEASRRQLQEQELRDPEGPVG